MRRAVAHRAALLALVLCWFAAACVSESPTDATLPVSLQIVSGDNQQAIVGHELPSPLVVQVFDAKGKPVSGQVVNFRVVTGGGSVYAGASLTNKDGFAQDYWTMGPEPGLVTLEVRAVDPTTGAKQNFATFTATALPELFTLVVSVVGSGFVQGNGIECPTTGEPGPGTCSADYPFGTLVGLTPFAPAGSVFMKWTGDCMGVPGQPLCSVRMDAPRSVQAVFATACQLLPHDNGLGQTYLHCRNLGVPGTESTYDESMALAAAKAWDAAASQSAFACGPPFFGGAVLATGVLGRALWRYTGQFAGFVQLNPPGGGIECPDQLSPTWN